MDREREASSEKKMAPGSNEGTLTGIIHKNHKNVIINNSTSNNSQRKSASDGDVY